MQPAQPHRIHTTHATSPQDRRRRDGFLRHWLRTATRAWQRRKMIATLEAMDDWLLRDIGIHRSDIKQVVEGFDERELRMMALAPQPPAARLDHYMYQEAF